LDFGLPILNSGEKQMRDRARMRSPSFRSDNPKSKIENSKWLGIVVIVVIFAMCWVVAEAQQPAKIPRIGWLTGGGVSLTAEAFRQGLHELGYIEGNNIVIEWRVAEGKRDRVPALASW